MAILGGPALYLIGNALFKRLSAPNMPLSHLVGLGLLALLAPAAAITTPLVLSAATTAVLIMVAAWEWLSLRNERRRDRATALTGARRIEPHLSGSSTCLATIAK